MSQDTDLVTLDEQSRRYVRHVLNSVGGNKSKAARILGVDRRTLYRHLAKMVGDVETDPDVALAKSIASVKSLNPLGDSQTYADTSRFRLAERLNQLSARVDLLQSTLEHHLNSSATSTR